MDDSLQQATNINIKDFNSYLEALHNRHDYFHSSGCRLSDHGLDRPYAEDYMQKELKIYFC